ncbi:MAG: carboxylesterase, partial [Spirochaetes bacterium]|nr:carboxylesterase [Spirochaetota bacterium]
RYLAEQYWKWNYMSPAAELLKIQKLCLKKLKKVTGDVFTIVSHGDQAIPVEVADIIEMNVRSAKCEKLILTESPHVMTQGPDKKLIADKLIDWFR